MADRAFRTLQAQGLNYITYSLTLIGAGSGKAPTLGEGDLNATFFAQPAFTSTGIFTLTMIDPFPGFVSCVATVMQATGDGTDTIQISPIPAASATNIWTFTFNNFVSGSAADLLTGDRVYIQLTMRNSGSTQG